MHAPNLGDCDQLAWFGPGAWLDSPPVGPLCRVGVPADLRVLRQLLVADSATLGEQRLDFLEDECVALMAVE